MTAGESYRTEINQELYSPMTTINWERSLVIVFIVCILLLVIIFVFLCHFFCGILTPVIVNLYLHLRATTYWSLSVTLSTASGQETKETLWRKLIFDPTVSLGFLFCFVVVVILFVFWSLKFFFFHYTSRNCKSVSETEVFNYTCELLDIGSASCSMVTV